MRRESQCAVEQNAETHSSLAIAMSVSPSWIFRRSIWDSWCGAPSRMKVVFSLFNLRRLTFIQWLMSSMHLTSFCIYYLPGSPGYTVEVQLSVVSIWMCSHPVSECDGSDVSAVDKKKDGSKYAALGTPQISSDFIADCFPATLTDCVRPQSNDSIHARTVPAKFCLFSRKAIHRWCPDQLTERSFLRPYGYQKEER